MLDTRSKYIKVAAEQRKYPRLELHCNAVVRGLNGIFTVTDISLGGVFIEPQEPVIVKAGQVSDIKIKLPEASNSIQVKIRFANQTKRGIGCEFLNLSPGVQDVIQECLETFRYTMPIASDQKPIQKNEPKALNNIIQCPQCKRTKKVPMPAQERRRLRLKLKCPCGHSWKISLGARSPGGKPSQAPPQLVSIQTSSLNN